MKAERRHELQENALATWLARQIELIKPYWHTIATVIVVVLAGILIYQVIAGRSTARKSRGWPEYFQAMAASDIGELEKVADDFPTSASGVSALQAAGDLRFVTGTNQLYSNPKGARLDLNEAVDDYSTVLDRAEDLKHDALIRRALFGLARANESLFEVSKAKERYQELVDRFPESPEAKVSERRLEMLAQKGTKEFLAWLAKQDFKPIPMNLPGTQPGSPGMGATLPGVGDPTDPLSFGPSPGGDAPGGDSPSTDLAPNLGEGLLPDDGGGTEEDDDRSSSFPGTESGETSESAPASESESSAGAGPVETTPAAASADPAGTTEAAPAPTPDDGSTTEESEESSDAP